MVLAANLRGLLLSLFVSIGMNTIQPFGFPSPAGDDGIHLQDLVSVSDMDQLLQRFATVCA